MYKFSRATTTRVEKSYQSRNIQSHLSALGVFLAFDGRPVFLLFHLEQYHDQFEENLEKGSSIACPKSKHRKQCQRYEFTFHPSLSLRIPTAVSRAAFTLSTIWQEEKKPNEFRLLCFCRPEGLLGQMNIFNMLTNMFLNAFNMTISLGELVLCSFLVDGSFDDQKYELEKIISALCSQYLSELQNDKILQPQDCNCLNLTIYIPAVQIEENYSFQSISS